MATPARVAFCAKLSEPPKFTGKMEETNIWITQFKWCLSAAGLDHKRTNSAAMMNIAAACLKGSAAQWFARITASA